MSDNIFVSLDKLKEKVLTANHMNTWWEQVKTPGKQTLSNCFGKVHTELELCTEQSEKIHTAVQTLMTNTAAWCNSVGMKFEETDQK